MQLEKNAKLIVSKGCKLKIDYVDRKLIKKYISSKVANKIPELPTKQPKDRTSSKLRKFFLHSEETKEIKKTQEQKSCCAGSTKKSKAVLNNKQ
mmetsp:Transcript_20093/g.23275  ORF Transcript_20093/g.23275 Transcript_20093/m.23275 type:complete len:94 (-) Transcript_20093:109-390(-)